MPIQRIGQFNFLISLWKGLRYGSKRDFNKIAKDAGPASLSNRIGSFACLFRPAFQARLYSSTTVCDFNSQTVLSNRLQGNHSPVKRLARVAKNAQTGQTAALYNGPEGPSEAAKKRAFERLQAAIFKYATKVGLIQKPAETSIDSTGLESHFVSRHFLMRRGKRTQRYRRWTKLTIVCEHNNHLIVGATVGIGPNNDAPSLPETVHQAVKHIPIGQLLADSGYDSENNHRYCREELGIPSTVIAINDRYYKGGPLQGRYRKQMKKHFPKSKFGQRWQVESVFSRFKRRLGYALRSHSHAARKVECQVRVLTYNLMILYLLFAKSKYIRKYCLLAQKVST